MTTTNQQLNNGGQRSVVSRLNDGSWYFDWSRPCCIGSGIVETLLGLEPCDACQIRLDPISYRVYGAICNLKLKNKPVDDLMLYMARALVSASAEQPIQGEALGYLLDVDARKIKELAKRLQDEWQLPVVASREKPYGYFYARTQEQLLSWARTNRSQAISMLVTQYHLLRSNLPELAGQQSLDFVNTVSDELQEAIR
jgi:hypothetical protein